MEKINFYLNNMTRQIQTKHLPKGWKEFKLQEVLDYEQPTEYIVNSEIIDEETPTPVLTANKGFVKGYTKEKTGIRKELPVIIFDDFTTDSKFVTFPFKVKSSAMKILKLKDKNALLKYIFYQMQTIHVRATTHKRYYLSEYQNLPFLFPIDLNQEISLDKQSLIVSAIEQHFTRLDEAVKSLKSVKAKLEVYRKAILKEAFKKSGDIPIKTCCEEIKQIIPQKENFNEFYYIDIASINNKRKIIESPKLILSKHAPSRARQETISGDVLYSTVRTYLRNIAAVPELNGKIISSTGFVVLRPKKDFNNKWVFYLLNTEKLNNDLSSKQVGTSYPAIRKSELLNYKVSVPSIQEQNQIVQEIESKFSVIDKTEQIV